MLGVGVIASAAVMAPVMNVLQFAYGIGEPAHAGVKALPAPQANLVKSVAEGMFGGTLPSGMIAIGAVIGVLIILLDLYLKQPRLALERAGARGRGGHLSAAGRIDADPGRRHRGRMRRAAGTSKHGPAAEREKRRKTACCSRRA